MKPLKVRCPRSVAEEQEDRLELENILSWLKDEGFVLPFAILSKKKLAEVIFAYRKYEYGAWLRSRGPIS